MSTRETTNPAAKPVSKQPITKPVAIAADFVAIAVFALLARAAHRAPDMPFTFTGWLSTLWPFALGVALGWLIARENKGGIIWPVTVVTGLVIWGLRNGRVPHWSFVLVATVMSALLMLGWRALAKLRK